MWREPFAGGSDVSDMVPQLTSAFSWDWLHLDRGVNSHFQCKNKFIIIQDLKCKSWYKMGKIFKIPVATLLSFSLVCPSTYNSQSIPKTPLALFSFLLYFVWKSRVWPPLYLSLYHSPAQPEWEKLGPSYLPHIFFLILFCIFKKMRQKKGSHLCIHANWLPYDPNFKADIFLVEM